MSCLLNTVKIVGFWGTKLVSLNLREDVNFLIGLNGTGKTTIINLISAVLRADVPMLCAVQFERVEILLEAASTSESCSVSVAKTADKAVGGFRLRAAIYHAQSRKKAVFNIPVPIGGGIYYGRHDMPYLYDRDWHRFKDALAGLVQVSWLPVNRLAPSKVSSPNPFEHGMLQNGGHETFVEEKVRDLSSNFTSYFSKLASEAEKENKNFVDLVFLSLLEMVSDEELIDQAVSQTGDRSELINVFKALGITGGGVLPKVNAFYERLEKAKGTITPGSRATDEYLLLFQHLVLSDAHRVRKMINRWNELRLKRAGIFAPKTNFVQLINAMFSGKELYFDERNSPRVHLASGDELDIDALSSGEKQLFILLGETMLQEGRPVVFLSDEPELSLHIKWQSELFKSVRQLNRSCQVISATHSPDIVGPFDDNRVIEITECMSDA